MCNCGAPLQAQDEHAGRRIVCPGCGAETVVPGVAAPPKSRGRGIPIAGITIALIVILGLALLLVPAVQSFRVPANRTTSICHLKQISMAFHNYHDVNKEFPKQAIY